MSFLAELSESVRNKCTLEVEAFAVRHGTEHRPIAVVTSGGTVADLEENSVRCIDNFSTGLRGAISVEELLKRGYAVIHLWRRGSASPFARVLSQQLDLAQANHALDVESMGKLFVVPGFGSDNQDHDDLVQLVLQEEQRDPWMTSPTTSVGWMSNELAPRARSDDIALSRLVANSSLLHKALRERSEAQAQGRLLTIPFRSVEDYLGKLELCARLLGDCGAMVLFFLAAAVSDFYVPRGEKALHKIQSDTSNAGLVLNLKPVPKTLGLLRQEWASDAFVVSFKLETDHNILRSKAERAVENFGCHLVVGNLLHSRHDNVWILAPEDQRNKVPKNAKDWKMVEVIRSPTSSVDSLESSIIDFVIQAHFEYISWHFQLDGSGMSAVVRTSHLLHERKERLHKELRWNHFKGRALDIAGAVAAIVISYSINLAIQRRLRI